ncbi:hypothetical protein KV102_17205 [Mumia sp. zg.B53]|uniref:GDSL-type esterase/lipase family protein n=1 Tax=Mumia sp. zg.B53 TaxID=2855449 RepID=UPI001C6E5739|nr:GDSL-type esterase/lipase family protein [Mumia sp. zg.B53]MBW9216582.1 hypothetical protein [Mumia sp. zg.B53]
MVAGDSITQGRAGDYTYRYWLWRGLRSVGSTIDLVGPRRTLAYDKTSYLVSGFDQDHAAMEGATTASLLGGVTEEVATHRPDVVVLLIGFNDLRIRTPATAAANIRAYVERVRAVDPAVDLVIGQVMTGMNLSTGARDRVRETETFNALVAGLVSGLNTPDSRVTVAQTAQGWDPRVHTWDGIHPTPTGQTRLAQRVADGLVGIGALSRRPAIDAAVSWPARFVVSGRGTDRRIHLSWDSTTIDGWSNRLRHRLVAPRLGAWVTTSWASGQTRSVTALSAGGTYEVQVQPRRGAMIGAWSVPIRVRATGRVPHRVRGASASWRRASLRVRWREAVVSDTYSLAYRTRAAAGSWSTWRKASRAGHRAKLGVPRRAIRAQVRITARNGYLTGPVRTLRTTRPR